MVLVTWLQQLPSYGQGAVLPTKRPKGGRGGCRVETRLLMPLDPGLQTLILDLDSEALLGLISSPSQSQYGASPAHPGMYLVTWPESSGDFAWATCVLTLDNRSTVCRPNCGPWSRPLLQYHPSEESPRSSPVIPETTQILHPLRSLVAGPQITNPTTDSATVLWTGSNSAWLWFWK